MYSPDSPHSVFCYPCWWSESWDAKTYARDYDFTRPFFEQFKELLLAVPRPGIIKQGQSINSEYTNRVTDMKNCYLVFATTGAENSRYSTWIMSSKECLDCFGTQKSERCYECIDCSQCYSVAFSQESNNCSDSWFLLNCMNVQNSFGCVNLKNKQYCIWNEQYTKEEYEKKIAELNIHSARSVELLRKKFDEFKRQFIVPALVVRQGMRVSGNWIDHCQDVSRSFTCRNVQNVRYGLSLFDAKDSMDFNHWGATAERMYEVQNCGRQIANLKFANECWEQVIDCEYVMNCHGSKDLFGCVGMKKSQYCILNKQYTKEEYETMVGKIKMQMDTTPYIDKRGLVYKYGEFFPSDLSPFVYNETMGHDFFPLSKEDAIVAGYGWRDEPQRNYKITMQPDELPDSAADAGDEVTKAIISCAHNGCMHQCTTAFRILPEDLTLYKLASLPLPRLCPNCRHYERIAKRNPLTLWPRSCQCPGAATHQHGETQCQNQFETSYAPDRPEKVYCIECYQQEVA